MFSMLGTIIPDVLKLVDKFVTDPSQALNLKTEVLKMQSAEYIESLKVDESQIDVDKSEAESTDKFVSRPRSAAEWMCLGILGTAWGIEIATNLLVFAGYPNPHIVFMSASSISTASSLLFGLLGIRAVPMVASVLSGKKK
jgi:hypothetical protein